MGKGKRRRKKSYLFSVANQRKNLEDWGAKKKKKEVRWRVVGLIARIKQGRLGFRLPLKGKTKRGRINDPGKGGPKEAHLPSGAKWVGTRIDSRAKINYHDDEDGESE